MPICLHGVYRDKFTHKPYFACHIIVFTIFVFQTFEEKKVWVKYVILKILYTTRYLNSEISDEAKRLFVIGMKAHFTPH